jgi:hypothetical protein
MIISVLVVLLQSLACVGLGLVMLRALRLTERLVPLELAVWSFALGFGGLGWTLFFFGIFGWFNQSALLGLLVLGSAGLIALRWINPAIANPDRSRFRSRWLLLAVLIAALVFDLLEGVSPPLDADSLAYHFSLPKLYLDAGHIVHVPRASTGAAPFLVHMTYVPVLGLGGEIGLTLWTMLSGWAAALLVFAVANRFMDTTWSVVTALVFLTLPATLYGAGSGQTEIRNVLMTLPAGVCVYFAAKTGLLRYAVAAGLATGFFMASKYTGLLFAASCGLVVLMQRHWFSHGMVFGLAALVAGSQWYFWNWHYTGDPLWPMLTGWFGIGDSHIWSVEFHEWFKEGMFKSNLAVPASPYWFLVYPIKAMFDGLPLFESGRTGLGPIWILTLPLALVACWQKRHQLQSSFLARLALVGFLFYVIWFFTGSSQRVRFLLPVVPLLLIPLLAASVQIAGAYRLKNALIAAFAITLVIQLGGHAVFTAAYAKYLFSGQSRDEFLHRNLTHYAIADWINSNLTENDKVLTKHRHMTFHIDVPVFVVMPHNQLIVEVRPESTLKKFYRQLTAIGVTYIVVHPPEPGAKAVAPYRVLSMGLLENGCAEISGRFPSAVFASRTLRVASEGNLDTSVLKVSIDGCNLR